MLGPFHLTVSFPLNIATMTEDTREIEKIVGIPCWSAGSGAGYRDVDFAFATRDERTNAIKRLIEAPGKVYELSTTYEKPIEA